MADRIVTVFGGTGFLGRRVVRHLPGQSLPARIASRHPERVPGPSEGSALQSMTADINDEAAVAATVAGAYGVVNAVSLYRERGSETFHALHVKAAERLARHARRAGVERLVHISGIGADATSSSLYIRSRGEGELAVQAAFANAIIVRPAVMFGQDDAFLNTLVKLLKRLPAYPMFGRGLTRLQPVYVEDVAEAIVRGLQPTAARAVTYELGGPRIYTYEELVRVVADWLGKRPVMFSVSPQATRLGDPNRPLGACHSSWVKRSDTCGRETGRPIALPIDGRLILREYTPEDEKKDEERVSQLMGKAFGHVRAGRA